jgi:hypothetical protein
LRAGINMTVPLCNSGFALPGASCWTVPFLFPSRLLHSGPRCYIEDFETSVAQDIGSPCS